MAGKRISKVERRVISQSRKYVKRSRESEFTTFGNNAESSRYERQVTRIGRA